MCVYIARANRGAGTLTSCLLVRLLKSDMAATTPRGAAPSDDADASSSCVIMSLKKLYS